MIGWSSPYSPKRYFSDSFSDGTNSYIILTGNAANGPENVGNNESGFIDGEIIFNFAPNSTGIGATNAPLIPKTVASLDIAA